MAARALKIAILGAESSGKTTLAQALQAALPRAIALPEALREFCNTEQRVPRADEQAALMQQQITREREAQSSCDFLIVDCPPLQLAAYSELYFQDTSLHAEAALHQQSYAMSFLCAADFPWVADSWIRDGAHRQAPVHALLLKLLEGHAPYVLLKGSARARAREALNALKALKAPR